MLVYPIIIYAKEKTDKYFTVFIPDFDGVTEGRDLADCLNMARDYIFNQCVEYENNGIKLPQAFSNKNKQFLEDEVLDIAFESFVDVDLEQYKRQRSVKTVKKNCSLPSWLAFEAEQANLNFSRVLQDGIKRELNIK